MVEWRIKPKSYRWEITMTVTTVQHGSHLTRTSRQFNGYDVVVGDFIAGATDGKALQIVSISAKTAFTVTCQVEDRLRYNTFRSSSGAGMFNVPSQLYFKLMKMVIQRLIHQLVLYQVTSMQTLIQDSNI